MSKVLSKIKISGVVYDLKDATARANLETLLGTHALEALGSAAWVDTDASVTDGATGVATTKAVKEYVDAQVGLVNSFDVVIDAAGTSTGPSVEASKDTMYKLYMIADDTAAAGSYIEWITIRSGTKGSYTYAWEKIGSTKADLTGYVAVERKVAGATLENDISVETMQTNLGLKNLAYADTATGTVASETISGVKATGTPEGTIKVGLTQTSTVASLTTADYTPAGSITGDAIKGGSIAVTLADGDSANASITYGSYTPEGTIAITADNAGTFQVGGTNSASDVTITATKGTALTGIKDGTTDCASFTEGAFTPASIKSGFYTAGKAATFTEGAYTPASLGAADTKKFTTDGIKAHIATGDEITGDVDAETLIFEVASTDDAVTGYSSFDGGSKAADTFDGGSATVIDTTKFDGGSKAADTFSSEKKPVADGTIEAWTGYTAATAAAQTFTGSKYAPKFTGTEDASLKATAVSYVKQSVDSATFTPVAATLGFTGTKVANALVTGVNYDKATIDAANTSFTGKAATFDVGDITVSSKDVTVTPDKD